MTIRHCSHCGLPLTDAASKDCGVGPVCRKLSNEMLAKTIPVDNGAVLRVSTMLLGAIHGFAPETQEVLTEVLTEVLCLEERGADLRKAVNRLDWACSFAHAHGVRENLVKLMVALGYVGLAAVVGGQASTTAATIGASNGRITVKGSKCTAAAMCFKKIQGWSFDGASKSWSFPASQAPAVRVAIFTAYPVTTIPAVDAAITEALAYVPPAPAVVAPPPVPVVTPAVVAPPAVHPSKASPSVTIEGGKLIVRTPYYRYNCVAAIKSLPAKERAWDLPGALKAWTIDAKHFEAVKAILADTWGYTVPETAVAA